MRRHSFIKYIAVIAAFLIGCLANVAARYPAGFFAAGDGVSGVIDPDHRIGCDRAGDRSDQWKEGQIDAKRP